MGTHEGLYTARGTPFEAAERARDLGTVHAVDAVDGIGFLAATDAGLFRSREGRRWRDLGVPDDPVVSVAVSPDGTDCYAGTYPARVYRLPVDDWDDPTAEGWTECNGFRAVPARERWADRSPRDRGSQARTLAVHHDAPDRLIAGVEVGGVCVSDDRGESWTERANGVHDDVHHVLALSPDEYIAATGNGLYRTEDAGRTWTRQDTDFRDFWFNYYREAVAHDGAVYTAANGWGPEEGHGAVFVLREDGSMERLPLRGEDSPFVLSWATDGDRLFAGTMGVEDGFEQRAQSDVLVYGADGWSVAGTVPAGVKSVAVR
ncbi:WD40/YVTN/BNR-like repeat-containing protein [Halostella salina]|uniref:WD40/YVTN/BNR-like repeat-containing protein n=1 Tax=Halostella salina TaxID=1547897 RepID=UPI000EF7D501|nr:glycosyl hydrolase [Halostella salina]